MINGRFDLSLIKAHRDAVVPLLMGDPSSVMYQVVVEHMGTLIEEVERLQKYAPPERRERQRYGWIG